MSSLNSQMVEVISGIRSEIKVDKEGRGSITRNGLCVLLGISRSNLSVQQMSKKMVEMLAGLGFEDVQQMFENGIPDVAVECIISYYAMDAQRTTERAKILYRAFAAVGVRAWFQDVVGYEKPKPRTELEKAREAYEYMGQMIAVMEYASDKPGQERINNYAIDTEGKCLPGYLTLEDVLATQNREYSAGERSAIGAYTAMAYRNLTGKRPEQVIKRYKDKSGKPQVTRVAAYPVDFLPVIQNAIELGFGS